MVLIRNFNIFKNMLEKYEDSNDKGKLISYIRMNLSNDVQEDDKLNVLMIMILMRMKDMEYI